MTGNESPTLHAALAHRAADVMSEQLADLDFTACKLMPHASVLAEVSSAASSSASSSLQRLESASYA